MTELRRFAEEYLSIRRAVGFKLARAEGLLFGFVTFAEAEGATSVSTDMALRWDPAGAGQSRLVEQPPVRRALFRTAPQRHRCVDRSAAPRCPPASGGLD